MCVGDFGTELAEDSAVCASNQSWVRDLMKRGDKDTESVCNLTQYVKGREGGFGAA